MTDDNVIEAAARAMCKAEGTAQCAAICLSHFSINTTDGRCPEAMRVWRNKARAALTAADKMRADGFDSAERAELLVGRLRAFERGDEDLAQDETQHEIDAAFAAGLAKGTVERAALVEALSGLVSDQHAHGAGCSCPWCRARTALALVPKKE